MGKSSIHIQKASGGAITHNSRENYSKSVVFTDEKNELWNDKKIAYEIYRSEFKKRVEAYTNRTNQKLQKTAVTHLSAVVNLEQHHTLKDLEKIKDELEKVFDTKVFQMAIHRDEGKIKHKKTDEYLVSGIDFFYNPDDKKYYSKKDKNTFLNELNIYEYDIEKNYHAHIELMGLDSQGQAIRQKMNRFVLSNLQDFTAETLDMERGNNYQIKKSVKRLDTHQFKESKKKENELKKENKKVFEIKEIELKYDIKYLTEELKLAREDLKSIKAERKDYAELEQLKKDLEVKLKNKQIEVESAREEITNFKNSLIASKKENEELKKLTHINPYLTYKDSAEILKEKYDELQNELNALKSKKPINENDVLMAKKELEKIKIKNQELQNENAKLKLLISNSLIIGLNEYDEEITRNETKVKSLTFAPFLFLFSFISKSSKPIINDLEIINFNFEFSFRNSSFLILIFSNSSFALITSFSFVGFFDFSSFTSFCNLLNFSIKLLFSFI